MKLTPADQDYVARQANFYFDVNWNNKFQDSVVYTGDGVEDLNELIVIMAAGTSYHASFLCNVGGLNSSYRPFDLEDLVAIRDYFIAYYGDVNKPNAYAPDRPTYIELPEAPVSSNDPPLIQP